MPLILMVSVIFFSCKNEKGYKPGLILSKSQQDTLLTDMITYIYIRPASSNNQTRHESQYRSYYSGQLNKFSFENYHITPDSLHYFYLIRPAYQGQKRGVGGKFRIDPARQGSQRLTEFEELFNTVIMPEDSLRSVGNRIFRYLVAHHHLDPFLYDPAIVEWPDRRLKYDKTENEWRYEPKNQ